MLFAITLVLSSVQAATQTSNYTSSSEKALGKAFLNHLHQQYDIIQDPEINDYIRAIGNKIVEQTNSQKDFSFYVINNPSINAFAGPNGVVGIHSGLIVSVANEDELASVIAHEIAHVTQEHLYRRMALQTESTLPQIASMIAAILIGIHDPNAGMATLLSSSAYQIEQQLKYSRLHEYEADFAGINYLSLSGYNPNAMPDFFQKLAKSYEHQGMNAPEILRTHPLTENRLAKAQARAASLENNSQEGKNQTLGLIQIRLDKLYKLRSTKLNSSKSEQQICYSKALDEILNSTENTQSIQCVEKLISDNVEQSIYHSIYIQLLKKIAAQKNNYPVKKDPLFSYEIFPSNESIVIRYAELLIEQKKYDEALAILEKFSGVTAYKNQTETLISKTYMRMNKPSYSYYHLALAELNIGNSKRAAILSQKALKALVISDKILKEKIQNLNEKLTKTLKNINTE